MDRAWQFLGSSTLHRLGRLTLREDAWRLPGGSERRYPVLHVGLTVGVVPFVDRDHVLLIRQFRHTSRATSRGSCRAAAGNPENPPKPRRSGSCARRAATAPRA